MRQQFHSATIASTWETLHDPFSEDHKRKLPVKIYSDGERNYQGFDSYTITGEQVGSVKLLLWKALQLDRQVDRQKRVIKELRARLRETQETIDRSIADLDPGQ